MAVTTDQYLSAQDQVDYTVINALMNWLGNEKRNLDDYLANPTAHVNHNPYLIIDTTGLQNRSAELGNAVTNLNLISEYKQGLNGITQSQSQAAFNNIPYQFLQRLYGFLSVEYANMEKIMSANGNNFLPLSEYEGLATFDSTSFQNKMNVYSTSMTGLATIIEYKIENP